MKNSQLPFTLTAEPSAIILLECSQGIHLVATRQPSLDIGKEFLVSLVRILIVLHIVLDVAGKVHKGALAGNWEAVETIRHLGNVIVKVGHCFFDLSCST